MLCGERMNDWQRQYAQQKRNAGQRGIPFDMTYAQWLEVWGDKIARRGRGRDDLVMCRTRDEGGYSVGNVRIDSPKGNMQEAAVCRKVEKSASAYVGSSLKGGGPGCAPDWMRRGNVFDEYTEDEEEYEY